MRQAVVSILVAAMTRGITLRNDGGDLVASPARAMSDDLLAAIRAHKRDVLDLLAEATPDIDPTPGPDTPPEHLPTVQAVRSAFARFDCQIIRAERLPDPLPDTTLPDAPPRLAVARLIRSVRRVEPGRAIALRDTWRERIAICIIDAGMSQRSAEAIALTELKTFA